MDPEHRDYVNSLPREAGGWINRMVQHQWSGGAHTAPEMRMIMLMLVIASRAKNVLELGSDAAVTTEVLALSGARVVGVDNWSEYPEVKWQAEKLVKDYPNCLLVKDEAVDFLRRQEDNSWDFIFVDDNHTLEHVILEVMEVRRVLVPGGIVAFHDTKERNTWLAVDGYLKDWGRINLPAISPGDGRDYGFGIARKPL